MSMPVEIEHVSGGVRLRALAAPHSDARRLPVLAIPGSYGEATRMAPALIEAFGDGVEWLCPDMPASREGADFGDPGIANVARLLADFARARFSGRRYAILGVSMGAVVGARIAASEPDRVLCLAVDDPALFTAQQWRVREVIDDLRRPMPEGRWRDHLDDYARAVFGYDPIARTIRPIDHTGEFAALRAPVLAIAGDEPLGAARATDKSLSCFDPESEAGLRATYRGEFLSIVRIAGLGHACLIGAPATVGPYLLDFFARHGGASVRGAFDDTALAARGLERAKAGRTVEAFADFLRLHAARPDDAQTAWFAGVLAGQAGDARAALGPLARACALPGRDPAWARALETALRAAPAGSFEAYRAAVRAAVAANPEDEALVRAYLAALPATADPLGETRFLEGLDATAKGPATRGQIAFARVSVLRALGEADAARDIARDNVGVWGSQAGDLTLLLSELYASDASDARIASAKARYYAGLEARGAERRERPPQGARRARPRLGFMSACFDQVSYMPLAHPMFAALDVARVEPLLFPLGGTGVLPAIVAALPAGAISPVPALGFDTENDPSAWRAAADHIRAFDLDLLVDLDDVLAPFSARLMMLRPARVQATWFNMSGPNPDISVDFVAAPGALYPLSRDADYAGKAMRLPDGLFVLDTGCLVEPPPPVVPGPLDRGEPLTFGSLSHHYKIGGATLDLWASVLRAVPDSRFHLANRDVTAPGVAARLLGEFERRGVAPARLSFAVAHGWPGYLEAYRDIDVVLATVPVSGGTTMFQAAWQGVEILSRTDDSPLGRIGRWLADAIGRPRTACPDDESVAAAARAIARDPSGVRAWRREARATLAAKSKIDAARLARAFEDFAIACAARA